MTKYNVTDDAGNFIMTAPLKVIAAVFGLRKEACDRIIRETVDKPCELHFNGRMPLGYAQIKVF